VLEQLPGIDVLYLTNNQAMADQALRNAIFQFVSQGKGLVLAHAATWYNWKDWPEYNAQLVGGGSRGHEKYGNFDVTITNTVHPITRDISEKQFNLKDELYRMIPDSMGAGIDVLAIATVPNTSTTFPSLWVTRSQKGRIVGFALGHDAEAHDRPVYQQILRNAVKWAAGK
jgi:type 1 glutamine amidotransferase